MQQFTPLHGNPGCCFDVGGTIVRPWTRGVTKVDPHVPKDMSVIKSMRSYMCMCVIYFQGLKAMFAVSQFHCDSFKKICDFSLTKYI